MRIGVSVDTRAFDKAFAEYKKNVRKPLGEVIVKKCYFIARDAVNKTATADPSKIKSELEASSRIAPNAPLAAILVNKQRAAKGQLGLNGSKMTAAVAALERQRIARRNWLRSGWIPSIKYLNPYVKNKGGAPKMPNVKIKGVPKGGAKVSGLDSWVAKAEIWNSIFGNLKPGSEAKVTPIIEKGLQAALDSQGADMVAYMEKELQKAHDKFNHS